MNTGTTIFKIHKSQQFVTICQKSLSQISNFMSKTTSLLKHMFEEKHVYRNEHYSSMRVVAMGQNVKTYPTTQCKFLLILKMGVSVFIGASCV